jgi:hypothetical protein
MATDYLEIATSGDVSAAIIKLCEAFGSVQVGTDEEYALTALLPVSGDLQPNPKKYNEITTIRYMTQTATGSFLVELGESDKVKKIKNKLKANLPVGVTKLTTAQARDKLPKENI